ncbi:hypothetical protein Hanom_Chr17g01550671 [Helianthus anomalus]
MPARAGISSHWSFGLSFNLSKGHAWSLWFTKILDLVPSFLKVHEWSRWFRLCNAFSPQLCQKSPGWSL